MKASQSKKLKVLFIYQWKFKDAWFDKDNYKVVIIKVERAGIFEGSEDFCKLEHKFLTVLKNNVTQKHYSGNF